MILEALKRAITVLVVVVFVACIAVIYIINDNKSLQKENKSIPCAINNCSQDDLPFASVNAESTITYSAEEKEKSREYASGKMEEIYIKFLELLPNGFFADGNGFSESFGAGSVTAYIREALAGKNSKVIKHAFSLIGIAVLFCISELVSSSSRDISASAMAVISICLSVPVLYAANDVLNLCKDAIESGSALFSGAIPLLTSALALGGGGATGAAASVGMSFSMSFVSGFLSSNLFPIAATLFTASIISSFDMNGGVANVSRGVRNWFNFGIGISSLIIAATFSLQTVIASAQDGIALRSAKYAASSMIPIVGGVVSGALGALLSGVGALTSSLGALSVAALLYICLSPLIMLLAYRLILGACIMITSFSAASFAKRFFEAIRGAVDCVIAVMASSLVLYIANITVFVTVARGIVL